MFKPRTNVITEEIAKSESSPFFSISEPVKAQQVRDVLAKSLANGSDAKTTMRQLATLIDDNQIIEGIVYTELNYAASAGIMAFGLESGAKLKEWQALPNCCDDCTKLDGHQVKIDAKFSSDDKIGHPPLHAGCNCGIRLDY